MAAIQKARSLPGDSSEYTYESFLDLNAYYDHEELRQILRFLPQPVPPPRPRKRANTIGTSDWTQEDCYQSSSQMETQKDSNSEDQDDCPKPVMVSLASLDLNATPDEIGHREDNSAPGMVGGSSLHRIRAAVSQKGMEDTDSLMVDNLSVPALQVSPSAPDELDSGNTETENSMASELSNSEAMEVEDCARTSTDPHHPWRPKPLERLLEAEQRHCHQEICYPLRESAEILDLPSQRQREEERKSFDRRRQREFQRRQHEEACNAASITTVSGKFIN